MMNSRRSGPRGNLRTPSTLGEWLDKWEQSVPSLKRRKDKAAAVRASSALDELELLLTRTVGKDLPE